VSIEGIFAEITKDVQKIFLNLKLFEYWIEITNKNEKLRSMDPRVRDWMGFSFTVDLVIRIACLCDDSKNTYSLVKWLRKLEKNEKYLSRKRFIDLYKNSIRGVDGANMDFDNLAGKGNDAYPTSLIKKDIKKLKNENPMKKIVEFRNQHLAHRAKKKNPPPTYKDLFDAIKVIEEIMIKYIFLMEGHSMMELEPSIGGYWKEVYTIPWAPLGNNRQRTDEQ